MECRAYGICLDSQSRGYLGKDRKVSSAAGGNLSRMHKTEETAKESRLNFMYSHLRNRTLGSSETDVLVLAGRTPFNGFFHKSFNTSCHSSPLMTRRVNFTSARMVTHSTAIPMLKPKNTSMIWNITLPRSLRLFQKGGTCRLSPGLERRH